MMKSLRIAAFSLILAAILKKSGHIGKISNGSLSHSKGTSQANFVQILMLLTKFEGFLLKNILRIAAFS